MELLCPVSDTKLTVSGFINVTEVTPNATSYQNNVTSITTARTPYADISWDYNDFTRKVAVPALCTFGIIGNILNIIIVSTRVKEGVDTMEKGALVGMMALAVSDFLFCVVTIPGAYLPEKFIWYDKDFVYYHTIYGNFLQNTLIKTSTWFTVILAVSRYVVVSNPIRARRYVRCIHTVIAILTCTVIWILLHIPLTYIWKVIVIRCPVPTIYLLVFGTFVKNQTLNSTFTYLWGLLGFILPIIILAYCNFKLIHSLRSSTRLRVQSQKGQKKLSDSNNQKLITVTLVSIVCMYFILVLPSELVHLYGEIAKPKFSATYRMFHVTSNLLQAINVSMNFVLYCCVNQYFRRVIRVWISRMPLVKRLIRKSHVTHYRFTVHKSPSRSLRSSVTSKQTTI